MLREVTATDAAFSGELRLREALAPPPRADGATDLFAERTRAAFCVAWPFRSGYAPVSTSV
jgi:hypothetical protein